MSISAASERDVKHFQHRRQAVLLWIVVAILTVGGVFVLPLAFPTQVFVRSSSYVVGFNNRIASLVVIGISLAVTAYLYSKKLGTQIDPVQHEERMPLRWFGVACLVTCGVTAVLGGFIIRSDLNYFDISYWQNQIAHWMHGGTLYRDVEFCYGPILFYWPAYFQKMLGRMGVGWATSFMVSLACMQVVGLGILFYVLQQLPLSRRLKLVALTALTFGMLTPLMGLNYTWVRFAAAYAALLWIAHRQRFASQAVLFFVATFLMLGISPEIGAAFIAGTIGYALYRCIAAKRYWFLLVPVPLLAFSLFAIFIDKGYFYTASNISQGLFNEVVQPFPYVYLFLAIAVALCPLAMAGYMRHYGADAGPIVGMYVASLAMVPSALGRCDGLHIFCSYAGLFLLTLIGLKGYGRKLSSIIIVSLLLVPLWSQIWLLSADFVTLKTVIRPRPKTVPFDLVRLEKIVGRDTIYVPLVAPMFVNEGLQSSGQLEPSYFSYATDAETVSGMQRKIGEMTRARYVLMPVGPSKWALSDVENNWKYRIFRLGYKYSKRRPVFDDVGMFRAVVKVEYDPVETFATKSMGNYILYRKKAR